ncbi:hypothetical protein [Bradyrhizobium ottawaense]|uniref:Uncharacterized protein n=1 Tax=Bradyrhizobium ottawaense TaxID=931866 RepID=A0ABY0QHC8_9BRAD|nr:hypothetical protein [Bradyrhizobium ottawaense]SDK44051.1 hypothetical protein SAMN05444163_8117 [Bradyrhizobium ottawaense]
MKINQPRSHEDQLLAKAAAGRLKARMQQRLKRYKVTLQWRRPDGLRPGGDPHNWRDWRVFAVIPILFHSEEEAWDYMRMVDIFKNTGRKASASVQAVRIAMHS